MKQEITHIWLKESEGDGYLTMVCVPVRIVYKKGRKHIKEQE